MWFRAYACTSYRADETRLLDTHIIYANCRVFPRYVRTYMVTNTNGSIRKKLFYPPIFTSIDIPEKFVSEIIFAYGWIPLQTASSAAEAYVFLLHRKLAFYYTPE